MKITCIIILTGLISELALGQTASAPLSYNSVNNLVIQNKKFSSASSAASIFLSNCTNVRIENCVFQNIPSMIGIQLSNCSNVEIVNCQFYSFRGGVYAQNSSGVNVHCNYFETIVGPKPRGQIVQFNSVSGSGNRINYNRLEHTLGDGDPEDLINCYASSGTSSDPLQIIGNRLRGGGPSTSGGGIMVGDNGGHDFLISENILVDPGQYGIAAPSGFNITIQNNKVFAKQQAFTNVGIYVGLQSEITAGFACVASTIKVLNNQVNWTNKNGIKNGFYNCPCCSGITSSGNNFNASSITAFILPSPIPSSACPSITLPLYLLELQLESKEDHDLLRWESIGNSKGQQFYIQTSQDGIVFHTFDSLISNQSDEWQTHSLAIPKAFWKYVRVAYKLPSGEWGYSSPLKKDKQQASIFYSASGEYCILHSESKAEVSIYNLEGKLLFKNSSGEKRTCFVLPEVSRGMLLVKILSPEGVQAIPWIHQP
ncbi:MAG: right-handed parallel beta-helix repeat-containing protein [Cytophagaceae bacterium]|jgi:hypothetical protein|nr:right-handed parallel beta-helix repeat-containing protein [Cytophagaceae bacterium]